RHRPRLVRAVQRRARRGRADRGDRQGAEAVRNGGGGMSASDMGGGDLRELYQEVIFDHNRKPRNFHEMPEADHVADGHNPLCGDRLTVYLRIEDGRIADVSFEGHGCAISTASASLMTEAVKGKAIDEVEALFRDVHAMLTDAPPEGRDFGKLQ